MASDRKFFTNEGEETLAAPEESLDFTEIFGIKRDGS